MSSNTIYFKMKSRLKIDDEACVNIQKKLMEMIVISIVVAIFGPLSLEFIDLGASAIQDFASGEYNETGTGIVNSLWKVLAETNIVYVVMLATFIFTIVFAILALMNKAMKQR